MAVAQIGGATERTHLLDGTQSEHQPHVLSSSEESEDWKPTLRLRFIQGVTWCNVFLTGFDSTVAASTYTTIASEFGAANNAVWVSTSYLITATAFQPLYGRLSDIFGRKRAFFFGTFTFTLGTLLCGTADSMLTLNLARALAGIGGGGLMTLSTIVLSDNVPFKHRGLYQSANNVMYGLGGACGASAGGIIAHAVGWRYAFLLQLPVAITAVIGGVFLIKDPIVSPLPPNAPVDVKGAVALVMTITTLLLGLSMGGNEIEWTSPLCLGFFVEALILFAVFLYIEAKEDAPILPRRMLQGTLPISNILTNFFSGMSVYAFLFMVPLFFLGVLLESTDVVGTRLILPALGFPLGALFAGVTMSRYGYLNLLVQAGCIILFIGTLLPQGYADVHQSEIFYFFTLIPVNIGQGLINPSSLFTMLAAFTHADQAVSTSTVYLFRNIGNVAGVAFSSAILQNYLRVSLPKALEGASNSAQVSVQWRY